ncbi:uncharacterized protein LOC144427129 [Styela clava]
MDFVEILFFLSLICGFLAELKVPPGACVSKIVDGKLIQVGDCKKNDGSDILKLIQKSLDEKNNAGNECGVIYKSKCFRAVVYNEWNVTFNVAESICKSMNNGKPANIYDLAHYQKLLPYLRSLIPLGGFINPWTGMEYKDNQLFLSNGIPITIATEVWRPDYRISDASRTNVAVYVRRDLDDNDQGIFNYSPSTVFLGVICEI